MVSALDEAMFGIKKDGINSDGGIVAEVRKQRSILCMARWAIGVAVATAIGVIVEMVMGRKGG
jgi:hypothetical protein